MQKFSLSLVLWFLVFASCEKVDITFERESEATDPSLVYIDDYEVSVATLKTDSFVTSGQKIISLGRHKDPLFAEMVSGSYMELTVPANRDAVAGKNVIFDSICLVLTPNGQVYGDSTAPLHFSVHQLIEQFDNDDGSLVYYYPRTMLFRVQPLANFTVDDVRPNRRREMLFRLPDALGKTWLEGLRDEEDEYVLQTAFREQFPGLYLRGDDGGNRSIFTFAASENGLIRIYFHYEASVEAQQTISYGFKVADQFNHIDYNYQGTVFTAFSPYRKELLSSDEMGGQAFIGNHMPSYMQVTLPGIFALKELSGYSRVVKAELYFEPAAGTQAYPYELPQALDIYASNSDFLLTSTLVDRDGAYQSASPVKDPTTGVISYRFDVTRYVNIMLANGSLYDLTLLIGVNASNNYSNFQRLVVNDQHAADGIKLKLHVLRL